jgi:hypothetical protein
MGATHEKIKQIEGLMAFGLSVSHAVFKALGCTRGEFAERHGVAPPEVSMCLLGYHQRTYPQIRDAICAELDIPREYLDRLIDTQRQPAESGDAA